MDPFEGKNKWLAISAVIGGAFLLYLYWRTPGGTGSAVATQQSVAPTSDAVQIANAQYGAAMNAASTSGQVAVALAAIDAQTTRLVSNNDVAKNAGNNSTALHLADINANYGLGALSIQAGSKLNDNATAISLATVNGSNAANLATINGGTAVKLATVNGANASSLATINGRTSTDLATIASTTAIAQKKIDAGSYQAQLDQATAALNINSATTINLFGQSVTRDLGLATISSELQKKLSGDKLTAFTTQTAAQLQATLDANSKTFDLGYAKLVGDHETNDYALSIAQQNQNQYYQLAGAGKAPYQVAANTATTVASDQAWASIINGITHAGASIATSLLW